MPSRGEAPGFSLVEVLMAMAVLMLILALTFSMMNNVATIWQRQRHQSAAFEGANAAFQTLTRALSQATLATYWDYQKDANQQPVAFRRNSDLHFRMGRTADLLGLPADRYPGSALFFQAPEGRTTLPEMKRLPSLLNGLGYFVAFGDTPNKPAFLEPVLAPRHRFRLMEWQEPVEDLKVYETRTGDGWFSSRLLSGDGLRNTAVLAENIVALIVMAEYPAPDGSTEFTFVYDSRDESQPARMHQLPPYLHVVMAAVAEDSARRLADQYGATPPPLAPADGLFQNPAQFREDIAQWEADLRAISPRVEFQVFSSKIPLKNAKWSQ